MTKNFRARTRARFTAVQALYQLDQTDTQPQTVVSEFLSHRLSEKPSHEMEFELFKHLVLGASQHKNDLDPLIEAVLADPWRLERLDAVLRAILRVGFFELKFELATPRAVIINDYVEITKDFFEGREPAFINGALDKGGQTLRPDGT